MIAGISVTHGGAPDGQELPGLIEKVQETGIEVAEVIGDMAYASDDNLEVYINCTDKYGGGSGSKRKTGRRILLQ